MDYYSQDYLIHYGVLGMKWGVRRYQNKDGSLTPAGGKRRNGSLKSKETAKSIKNKINNARTKKVEAESAWFQKFSDAVDIELRSKETHNEWNNNQSDRRYKITSINEYGQPKGWYRQDGTGLQDYYKEYGLKSYDQARSIRYDENHPAVKQFKADINMSSKYDDWIEDRAYKNPEVQKSYNDMMDARREYDSVIDKYGKVAKHSDLNENELYHWGVKGMKWGVRRFQNKDGSLTPAGGKRYNGSDYRLKNYTSPTREAVKSIPKRLALNIAASVIPGFGLAYNANVIRKVVNYNLDGKDYTKKEGSYEKISELKKKTQPTDISDDLKQANPRLGAQKGKVNNCTFCTVAMEMRQRGYDVRARSKAQGAVTEVLYSNMFKDFKMNHPSVERLPNESRKDYVNRSYDTLCKEIAKNGNGSRGYVGIQYEKVNSGHAMYWKVENNRVNFYDGQSGKVNPDKLFALANPSKYSYARLDNLKLKDGVTEAIISNRKENRNDR